MVVPALAWAVKRSVLRRVWRVQLECRATFVILGLEGGTLAFFVSAGNKNAINQWRVSDNTLTPKSPDARQA